MPPARLSNPVERQRLDCVVSPAATVCLNTQRHLLPAVLNRNSDKTSLSSQVSVTHGLTRVIDGGKQVVLAWLQLLYI